MKKFIAGLFALVSLVSVVSCGSAEGGFTEERFVDNIFTVNKHTVTPEYSDTSYMVTNMDSYALKTGDRARMILRYYYDAYSGKMPEWSIYSIDEVIPTRPLLSADAVDTTAYSTPITALVYYEFMDRFVSPVWIWKNRQNLNVSYNGIKERTEFAMIVRGISEDVDAVGNSKRYCLDLELRAKSHLNTGVKTTQLLTFDLANVGDFLTAEQKRLVAGVDSLHTKIYLKRLERVEDVETVRDIYIMGGSFANPLK